MVKNLSLQNNSRGVEHGMMSRLVKLVVLLMIVLSAQCAKPAEAEEPHPATNATQYPTIKILDFALDRKCEPIDLRDDYNCPQTLASGLTLNKPVELPIDLPTVLKLAGARNLDLQLAREKLAEARAQHEQSVLQFFPWIAPGLRVFKKD